MIDLDKQREVSEETMALVEAVLERLEFHAFEEVLIWSEEHASKALRRCLKNTLNEFKSGKLILTSSYPKLKHYSVDSVVDGLQTALTQAQKHHDNLNEQINSLKAQLEKVESGEYVVVPKECPDPIFADKLFDLLCKKAHGEFGDDQMIFFSDIDEIEIWKTMIKAAQENSHE